MVLCVGNTIRFGQPIMTIDRLVRPKPRSFRSDGANEFLPIQNNYRRKAHTHLVRVKLFLVGALCPS